MNPTAHFTKKRSLITGALFLVLLTTTFLFTHQDERKFHQLTDTFFHEEMVSNTLNMHYSLAYPENFGIKDYEPILPAYSKEYNAESQEYINGLLQELDALSAESLSKEDNYTYQLLERYLNLSLEMNQYPYYNEPLSPSSGMQSQLPILLAEYTFRSKQDVENYLAILDQTDEYFASLLTFEQEKASEGLLMSASSLDKVIEQCDTIVTKQDLDAGTHFLQSTFTERLQTLIEQQILTADEAIAYQMNNDRLLRTVLLPAYENLGDGLLLLKDTSIPLEGLAAKPQGADYYKLLLASETGSYRDIADVKKLLLAKLEEEYNALVECSRAYRDGNYTANGSFPYEDSATMLHDLQQRMQTDFPPLESDHSTLPSVTVKEVTKSLQEYSAPAFYLTAPIDDTDNNVIYINPQNQDYGLELYTTLAHEGYPGHLYQTVYSNRYFAENDINSARQLLWYGGYMEGWALYVEFLSYDYGVDVLNEQNQPAEALMAQIKKHNRSLQLCLYSLLDIMIHYENVPYSQVAKTLQAFGITDLDSINAIYTYIVEEPCNYLKYYLGYLEILELQNQARDLWGVSYSDYSFHQFYLNRGDSDFTSLSEYLTEYGRTELNSATLSPE